MKMDTREITDRDILGLICRFNTVQQYMSSGQLQRSELFPFQNKKGEFVIQVGYDNFILMPTVEATEDQWYRYVSLREDIYMAELARIHNRKYNKHGFEAVLNWIAKIAEHSL